MYILMILMRFISFKWIYNFLLYICEQKERENRRVYHTCEKKKEKERVSCIKKSSMLLYGKMKDFKILSYIS